MFRAYSIFAALFCLVWCKADFRNDSKSVMYTVSKETMPWIQSSKVLIYLLSRVKASLRLDLELRSHWNQQGLNPRPFDREAKALPFELP